MHKLILRKRKEENKLARVSQWYLHGASMTYPGVVIRRGMGMRVVARLMLYLQHNQIGDFQCRNGELY